MLFFLLLETFPFSFNFMIINGLKIELTWIRKSLLAHLLSADRQATGRLEKEGKPLIANRVKTVVK